MSHGSQHKTGKHAEHHKKQILGTWKKVEHTRKLDTIRATIVRNFSGSQRTGWACPACFNLRHSEMEEGHDDLELSPSATSWCAFTRRLPSSTAYESTQTRSSPSPSFLSSQPLDESSRCTTTSNRTPNGCVVSSTRNLSARVHESIRYDMCSTVLDTPLQPP